MYLWRDGALSAAVPAAHLGPVLHLAVHPPAPKHPPAGRPAGIRDGREAAATVATAGKDGVVRFWEVGWSGGGAGPGAWVEVAGVGPGIRLAEATEGLVRRPAAAGPVSVRAVALTPGWREGMWHVAAGTGGDEVWLVTLPHLRTTPTPLNSAPAADGRCREYLSVADGGGGRLPAVECVVQGHVPAWDGAEAGCGGAVAMHPQREDKYVTCGGDGVLRVWDALACRPAVCTVLPYSLDRAARPEAGDDSDGDGAAAASSDGDGGGGGRAGSVRTAADGEAGGAGWGAWSLVAAEYSGDWGERCHLAVAMVPRAGPGAGPGAGRGGDCSRVAVLRISDAVAGADRIEPVCVLGRREGLGGRRVTCLRYSAGPDGLQGASGDGDDGSERLLAVGTWDGCVVVYAADLAREAYTRRAVLRGHARPVTALDFGAGGRPGALQSCSAWELRFWDLEGMRARKTASADRDTAWWAGLRGRGGGGRWGLGGEGRSRGVVGGRVGVCGERREGVSQRGGGGGGERKEWGERGREMRVVVGRQRVRGGQPHRPRPAAAWRPRGEPRVAARRGVCGRLACWPRVWAV